MMKHRKEKVREKRRKMKEKNCKSNESYIKYSIEI